MIALGIGPFQESMTLWPSIQIYSKMGRLIPEMERLSLSGWSKQDPSDKEQIACFSA